MLPELTGTHICIKCLKEIPFKEFDKNDHRCKECAKLPNYWESNKCDKCPHVPHKEQCGAPIIHDGRGNAVEFCECKG